MENLKTKTQITKVIENGRMLIKVNVEDNEKTIVNIKENFNPKRNIINALTKMGLCTDFEFVSNTAVNSAVKEQVFVSKKDAKPGDLVKMFGTQIFEAYLKDNEIKFRKVKN